MTLSPYSDSLSLGLRIQLLNPATSYKSPAHSSTGTRSVFPPTACQLTVSCSFSLPYGGSISPFHRCTSSLSVTQEYLALRGGPRRFTRDSTCPMLLGIFQNSKVLTTGLSPSLVQDSAASSLDLFQKLLKPKGLILFVCFCCKFATNWIPTTPLARSTVV